MSDEMPDLAALNTTELLHIIRRQTGVVVRRSVARERLVEIVENGGMPAAIEVAGTMESRALLQEFIRQNWDWINSQLPCKGENRGKCLVYQCPEGRHLDCYLAAKPRIRATLKVVDD